MTSISNWQVDRAVDCAVLEGLVRRTDLDTWEHAPFTLTPAPIPSKIHQQIISLTPPFNTLALKLSNDIDFLKESLSGVIGNDPFTEILTKMARPTNVSQPIQLLVTRNDFFVQEEREDTPSGARQVELNTVAAGYGGLTGCVNRVHQVLGRGSSWENSLVLNSPLQIIADGFQQAYLAYGQPNAIVLMVIQPAEKNIADQRLLEFALDMLEIRTRRATLSEIAEKGQIKDGHLVYDGNICAITYFRAGYTPDDFLENSLFQAREMIENSSTIAVPTLSAQLAGTKKIQQLLTKPHILRQFTDEKTALKMEATFAIQADPEETILWNGEELPAWEIARKYPGQFVLKPQREGGGNNYFDQEMATFLSSSDKISRSPFIVMERIFPPQHMATMVFQGEARQEQAHSEIGRYGVTLVNGSVELTNKDVGYLVRTKGIHVNEGGVSAGYGFLDSLMLID